MKHIVKNVLMLAAMLMASANASAVSIPDFEVGKWSYNILSEEEKTVEVNCTQLHHIRALFSRTYTNHL